MDRMLHNPENAGRILQLITDSILVIDNNGVCIDAIICDELPFLDGDYIGKNTNSFISPEIYQDLYLQFGQVRKTETKSECIYKYMLNNEDISYFQCIMHPYDDGIIICQIRDVTDIQTAKAKAEVSDRQKSAFLANMSHEIRTPLNAIVGFSKIIADSDDAEERAEYFDIVDTNTDRLLQLISEILDLSKIESGILEFTYAPTHLYSLCKEVFDAHIFRCPQRVDLIFEDSDDELKIESDKTKVFQVLSNLIGNAFKFTHNGSVSFGYKQEGNKIKFHVTDTGSGIHPDKLPTIFDRFVKADNHAQGTGLGLSICKSILERLGGEISATSECGKGTSFTFTLPYKASGTSPILSEKIERSKGEAVIHRHNGISILVAEDTPSNFDLLKAILSRNYQLYHAKDGIEAVTMFDEIKPDIVLMDLKMPNMDGLSATRIIRELSSSVPIIVLSAYAFDHDKKAAFESGCNDFLSKPFSHNKLKEVITNHLN